MRNYCNDDNKIESPAQNPDSRRKAEAVKGDKDAFLAGYTTLDRVELGEDGYGAKERKGLTRNANYPRRY